MTTVIAGLTPVAGFTYTNSSANGLDHDHASEHPRGFAFESGNFFIHLYGKDGADTWGVISPGLAVTEPKSGQLSDWVRRVFGASDLKPLVYSVGFAVEWLWRPGRRDTEHLARADFAQRRAAEQSLYLLIDALNDLLLYIEPEGPGLSAYSPKTRELLILASTEVENTWAHYLGYAGKSPPRGGFSTNDYVALRDPLYLQEFQVALTPYANAPKIRPFYGWDSARPTQSLPWYDAYNKAKHDRSSSLNLATLLRCIEAVVANVVLFCIRFNPGSLFDQTTPVCVLANHLFQLEIVSCDPATFYVPFVELTDSAPGNLQCWSTEYLVRPRTKIPLTV